MAEYHLPAKEDVAIALKQRHPVVDRLIETATKAGYVFGEGGVQIFSDGSAIVDADRDPTVDWLAWNPYALMDHENVAKQLRQSVINALKELDQIGDTVEAASGAVTPAQLVQMRTAIGRLARIQEGTIKTLINLGIVREDMIE